MQASSFPGGTNPAGQLRRSKCFHNLSNDVNSGTDSFGGWAYMHLPSDHHGNTNNGCPKTLSCPYCSQSHYWRRSIMAKRPGSKSRLCALRAFPPELYYRVAGIANHHYSRLKPNFLPPTNKPKKKKKRRKFLFWGDLMVPLPQRVQRPILNPGMTQILPSL